MFDIVKAITFFMIAMVLLWNFITDDADDKVKVSQFEKGLAYFEKGEFQKASLAFSNVLKLKARNLEALKY